MLAEDLNLAPVLTFWNDVQPDEAKAPARDSLVRVEPDRAFHLIAYEQEPPGLGGTAALYFNLCSPIPYGENMVAGLLRAKEQGAWAEIEKPYVWDAPALLATDLVDSIQFAPNLFSWWMKDDFASCRELNWGRPRDFQAYPGLCGHGLWIQDLYYRVLNCGFRIPTTDGTACGINERL